MISTLKSKIKTVLQKNERLYRQMQRQWRRSKRTKTSILVLADYYYDWRRYVWWSHGGADVSKGQLERVLLRSYHGIEKGLSLAAPRPGFGQDKIKLLIDHIDNWLALYGYEGPVIGALASLREYQSFNREHGVDVPFLDEWLMDKPDVPHLGGTVQKTRAEIQKNVAKGGEDFFFSRHSIRNFSGEDVPMEAMRKAIRMARKTPSVCNRQGPRVYCFENAMDALQWQPGNKGFGDLASRGLVVTSDLRAFTGTGERNQCWVDGGMFAMSILYALHSLGYGACPLAWAPEAAVDKKMRRALDIPDHQGVIMMIAVGVLPEKLNVAVADRYDLEDVLIER